MTSIEDFIKARESIEKLVAQITLSIERKAIKDCRKYLDTANHQLETLKAMVSNDTQILVDSRLSAQLGLLGAKVEKLETKTPVRKRPVKKKTEEPVKTDITEEPDIVVFAH